MVALSTLIGGSGGGADTYLGRGLPVISLLSSQVWAADFTGLVRVHVVGAGGGGYANSAGGTGGGAGGYSRKDISVSSGDQFTVTIGAGGSQASAGSPTSFAGGAHDLVANGGFGGVAINSGDALGGTASGGDHNITGGNGGATTGDPTGGGAVGVLGVGFPSVQGFSNSEGGGAGIGGSNADYYGGGSGGAAISIGFGNGSPGPALLGTRAGDFDVANILPFPGSGGGIGASYWPAGDGGAGAGGGGSNQGQGGAGGAFAGGGAGNKYGGAGCWGGGGGGGIGTSPLGGHGGDGVVLIEILSME